MIEMGAIETASGPGHTVDVGSESPIIDATAVAVTNKPGLLAMISISTYGNGCDVASAAYGDANATEGEIYQFTIEEIHPQSNTPYDKATAYAVADPVCVKRHVINKTYWLKGSSLTILKGAKIICAASGLVAVQTAHTATPLPHHTWVCAKAVSAATWVQGTYIGITSMFTA